VKVLDTKLCEGFSIKVIDRDFQVPGSFIFVKLFHYVRSLAWKITI